MGGASVRVRGGRRVAGWGIVLQQAAGLGGGLAGGRRGDGALAAGAEARPGTHGAVRVEGAAGEDRAVVRVVDLDPTCWPRAHSIRSATVPLRCSISQGPWRRPSAKETSSNREPSGRYIVQTPSGLPAAQRPSSSSAPSGLQRRHGPSGTPARMGPSATRTPLGPSSVQIPSGRPARITPRARPSGVSQGPSVAHRVTPSSGEVAGSGSSSNAVPVPRAGPGASGAGPHPTASPTQLSTHNHRVGFRDTAPG